MSSARPQDYAKAYLRAQEESGLSPDELIERLIATTSKNSDKGKLPQIARRIEEDMTRAAGGKIITITSARELPQSRKGDFIASFGPNDVVRFVLDEKLHAGVRITINGQEEFDASFAQKLSRLFS